MDSAEPLSSMEPRLRGSLDSTSSPQGIRCGGALLLPRAYTNLGSLYPVQVAYPQFRILFGYLCSGWYRLRFSRVVGLVSFVFHYWGVDRSCLRLRGVLLYTLVGFALTAIGSFLLVGNGRGWSVSLVA